MTDKVKKKKKNYFEKRRKHEERRKSLILNLSCSTRLPITISKTGRILKHIMSSCSYRTMSPYKISLMITITLR